MGASNAACVVRYYELVDAGELEAMYALFAADVVYDRPGYEPLRGIGAFRAFYESQRMIETGFHTVRSLVVAKDQVAVEGEFAGVLRDGQEIHLRFADFFTFRDQRIVRRNTYFHAPLV